MLFLRDKASELSALQLKIKKKNFSPVPVKRRRCFVTLCRCLQRGTSPLFHSCCLTLSPPRVISESPPRIPGDTEPTHARCYNVPTSSLLPDRTRAAGGQPPSHLLPSELLFAPALGRLAAHPRHPATNGGAAPWQPPVPRDRESRGGARPAGAPSPGAGPGWRRQLPRRTIARRAPLPAAPVSGTARHTRPGAPVPAPGGPGGLPGPGGHHGGALGGVKAGGSPPAVPGAGPRGNGGAGPGPAHTKGAPRTPPPAAAAPASPRRWALCAGAEGRLAAGPRPLPYSRSPPPRL